MRRFFANFLLILGLPLTVTVLGVAVPGTGPAAAQELLRAAAVINDEIISLLDLDIRLRLAIFAAGPPDSAEPRKRMTPQVLRVLIDERLQSQEAERLGITVTDQQVAAAAEEIAQRNKLSSAAFDKLMEGRGIIPSAFLEQVRGQRTLNDRVARGLRRGERVAGDERVA